MKIRNRAAIILLVVGIAVSFSAVAFADMDMQGLMDRMDKLEKENSMLRAEVNGLKGQVTGVEKETKDLKSMTGKAVDQNVITNKPPVAIEMYGYIKTDISYNDSQIGELPSEAAALGANVEKNDELTYDVRESRIGFNFKGPELFDGGEAGGKIEVDFWNTLDGSSTSPAPRIRQAYAEMKFPKWAVLAGQTWDFFSPLNPASLNFNVLWRQGNLGDRHPMAVLTNKFEDVLGGNVTTKLGALDESTDGSSDEASPVIAGYATYDTKAFDQPLQVGVGGMYGRTEKSTATVDKEVEVWALTGHLKYDLTDELSFSGEVYKGAGLSPYRANGDNTTQFNTATDKSKGIAGAGGWAQISYKATDRITINNGYGIDDVSTDAALLNVATWDYNYSHFHNVKYKLAKNTFLGFEYQRFVTKYDSAAGGNSNRFLTSLIYNF